MIGKPARIEQTPFEGGRAWDSTSDPTVVLYIHTAE